LVTDWTGLVGYQHEVMHTGVLRHLLADKKRGPSIAMELIERDVVSVSGIKTEARIKNFKGKPDLIAAVDVGEPEPIDLAVETKVDSTATPEQLKAEALLPVRGILLALGITALAVPTPVPWVEGWKVITPRDWATLLRENGALDDPVLETYLSAVDREAELHATAWERAGTGLHPGELRPQGRHPMLQHYAWLARLREATEHPQRWWTNVNRSGPTMQIELPRVHGADDAVTRILQFMCSEKVRRLCLMVGSRTNGTDIRHAVAIAQDNLDDCWQRPLRAVSASARFATVASRDFTALGAPEAAQRTQRLIGELAAS
jgi:hypothetical protein